MAVTERFDSRAIVEAYGFKERTRNFIVSPATSPEQALADPDMPKLGTFYPGSLSLRVVRYHIQRLTPTTCEVEVTYGTISNIAPSEREVGDVEEEVEVAYTTETTYNDLLNNQPIGRDGKGLEAPRPQIVYRYRCWQTALGFGTIAALVGKVNDRSFKGFPATHWLLEGANARRVNEGKWEVLFTYRLNPLQGGHRKPWKDKDGVTQLANVYQRANIGNLVS